MTTRRSLLKYCALATLPLAGCLGTADPAENDSTNGTTDPTTTPDPTATPTPSGNGTDDLPGGNGTDDAAGGTRLRGTGGPGVTVVATDGTDGPVEHAVEVVREAATDEAPPGLRVSITNTGDEPLAVGEGRDVVFAYRADDRNQLTLLPPGEYAAEAGCWRLSDPVAVTMEYRVRTLDPGQTVTQDLDLYALPGEDACLPVGEYRFETTYRAGPSDDGTAEDADTEYSWGFSILLE